MCEDCVLTREQAAYLIKTYRDSELGDAYRNLFERMVWSLDQAGDDMEDAGMSAEEVERIWESIDMA